MPGSTAPVSPRSSRGSYRAPSARRSSSAASSMRGSSSAALSGSSVRGSSSSALPRSSRRETSSSAALPRSSVQGSSLAALSTTAVKGSSSSALTGSSRRRERLSSGWAAQAQAERTSRPPRSASLPRRVSSPRKMYTSSPSRPRRPKKTPKYGSIPLGFSGAVHREESSLDEPYFSRSSAPLVPPGDFLQDPRSSTGAQQDGNISSAKYYFKKYCGRGSDGGGGNAGAVPGTGAQQDGNFGTSEQWFGGGWDGGGGNAGAVPGAQRFGYGAGGQGAVEGGWGGGGGHLFSGMPGGDLTPWRQGGSVDTSLPPRPPPPPTFGRQNEEFKIGDRVLYTNAGILQAVEATIREMHNTTGYVPPSYDLLTSAGRQIEAFKDDLQHVQPIKQGDRVLYTNGVGNLPVQALVSGVFEFMGRPSYALLTSAGQRIYTSDDHLRHVQPVRRGVSCDEERRTRSLRRVEIRPLSLGSRHHPR
ncbi:unnamed protein product [Ectocarpus sp. 12 AP-2014]